jgi:hypothetical protein
MAHIDLRNRGGTIRYVARYIDPPAASAPRASLAAPTPRST